MERFFILDNYNTYYDWNLILTAKDVTPPDPKTNYVELDGMSGTLDLSEALSGEVSYKDRTVLMSFFTNEGNFKDRERLYREITRAIHGKKIQIIEPDDNEHYFLGRGVIKSWVNNLAYAEIEIEFTCDPWRYALEDTVRTVYLSSEYETIIINYNGVKTVRPTLKLSTRMGIQASGIYTYLDAGEYILNDLRLKTGVNTIVAMGNVGDCITITYRECDI